MKNISENKLNVINQSKRTDKIKSPPPKTVTKKTREPKKKRVLNLRIVKLPGTPLKKEFVETPMDADADKAAADDVVAEKRSPKKSKAVKAKATKAKPPAKSKSKVSEIPDDIVNFVLETPKVSRSDKVSSLHKLTACPLDIESVENIDVKNTDEFFVVDSPPRALSMDSNPVDKSLVSNASDTSVDICTIEVNQSINEEEDQTVPTSENYVLKNRILTQKQCDDSIIILENQAVEIINISDLDSTIDSPVRYNFDMLQTDDETDDEDNLMDEQIEAKSGKARPKPPFWSLNKNREEAMKAQSQISAKTMDNFFYENEEVDLKEIFPNIDSKKIARRPSSCHWTTPPRYSIMPKY